ncbi:MAG: CBS domain-containing protein [Candidatus Bipolaricaulia bacterium]
MQVRDYMRTDPVAVTWNNPVQRAKELMDEHRLGVLLVTDEDGVLAGFLTRRSVTKLTAEGQQEALDRPIQEVVSSHQVSVEVTDPIEKAALLIQEHGLIVLPILDAGKLVGILTQSDISRAFAEMIGIREGGTRITIKLRSPEDLYQVTRVFEIFGVEIISITRDGNDADFNRVTIRAKGIQDEDKQPLKEQLEEVLQ